MRTMLKAGTVVVICLTVLSCTKEEILSTLSNSEIAGTWQMTTSRIVVKGEDNGKPVSADQTRNGVTGDVLEIKLDGSIKDPNDLFKTKTYAWEYTLNGDELILSNNPKTDKAYFTLKLDGNKMVWLMNTEQTKRTLTDTNGKSPVLNGDSSMKDYIIQNDFTIKFARK